MHTKMDGVKPASPRLTSRLALHLASPRLASPHFTSCRASSHVASPRLSSPWEQAAAGARALSRAYAAAAALAFVGYTANLCLAGLAFGSPRAAVGALWAEAPPAVAFMSIDAGVLFLGRAAPPLSFGRDALRDAAGVRRDGPGCRLLLHLASTSPAEALAALLASPLVGPGAACALMLSRREARLGEAAAGEAAGAGETKKLA